MVSATRTVTPLLPAETGVLDGLAYTLWLPPSAAAVPRAPGVVVLHGADSCKESHHDFARAAVALGLAAICFDQRGHGESGGPTGCRRARGRRPRSPAACGWRSATRDAADRAARLQHGRLPGDRSPPARPGRGRWWPSAPPARPVSGGALTTGVSASPPTRMRCGAFLDGHDLTEAGAVADGPAAASARRGRRAGADPALAGAGERRQRARQPADRRPRRSSPLDPARWGAAGGEPAVRRAVARARLAGGAFVCAEDGAGTAVDVTVDELLPCRCSWRSCSWKSCSWTRRCSNRWRC